MEYNRKNARFLSMLGHRGAFAVALMEIAESEDDLVVLTADMTTLTGLDRFKNTYPDKLYNVGIAEQNLIGVAAGFALEGNTVFATTYANFITMRAYEQIRVNLGYMKQNVKVVGTTGGLEIGVLGNTHYAIEDMALMRAIPNMVILSPADGFEIVKAVKAAALYDGPVYLRLAGLMNMPIVYTEDFDFVIGKSNVIKEGKDITIFATGTMVSVSLQAAKLLETNGVNAKVVDVHTIKPLDKVAIHQAIEDTKLIVTVEEHTILGGLGSAVAETMAESGKVGKLLRLGIDDCFCKPGDYQYLLEQNGLTKQQIADKILEVLEL